MTDDPDLRALLDGVVSSVDDEIATDPGCPDFAAMVARAHELDPQRVKAEVVAEVNQWAPVVSIQQAHRRRRTRDDEELLAVIEGVRSEVEQDVAQRLGTPPPLADAPQTRGRRVWGLVLAAAAVVLIVGAGVIQAGTWRLTRDEATPSEAVHVSPVPSSEPVHRIAPPPEPEPRGAAVDESPDEPEADLDEAQGEPEAIEPEATPADAEPTKRRPPRTPPPTLEELDAMAHAAWRAGDLPKAERLFRALAKRAGTGRLGDLAYGDLFTLARQRKDSGKEAKLWREYLRRFPEGRFADDARAGLCRRASGDAQRKCWARYLEDVPKGAHRAQAERALAAGQDAP